MIIVPKGKTICIGGRKFVEGDVVPPYFRVEVPEKMTRDEAEKKAKTESKSKRSYRSRSGSVFTPSAEPAPVAEKAEDTEADAKTDAKDKS